MTGHILETLSTGPPPTALSSELRDRVRLRVNDAGDAEWVVLGPTPNHGVIDMQAQP